MDVKEKHFQKNKRDVNDLLFVVGKTSNKSDGELNNQIK